MKKIILGAAIAAALSSGVANASITFDSSNQPDAATMADTTSVFLSGSSALAELFERGLANGSSEGVCKTGTVHRFSSNANTDQVAYLCELNTAANGSATPNTNIPSGITKSNLLMYKRNAGGSAKGVLPIITPAAIEFLNVTTNPSNCTANTVPAGFATSVSCPYNAATNMTSAVPTFGISDVNPQLFTTASENAVKGTLPGTPPGPAPLTYQVVPGPAAVFGVTVTTKLRNALQEAQFPTTSTCNPLNGGYTTGAAGTAESEACMPNLNSKQIAEIFAASPAPNKPLTADVIATKDVFHAAVTAKAAYTDKLGVFHPAVAAQAAYTDLAGSFVSAGTAPALGAGRINSWKQLKIGTSNLYDQTTSSIAGVSNKPASPKVHICSRTIGSGTKAQLGIKFLNNTCSTSGAKVVQNANHVSIGEVGETGYIATGAAMPNPELMSRPMVHAMASSGDLEECMDELDQGAQNATGAFAPGTVYTGGTRWAIGIASLDKNTNLSKNHRFVKIDGATPNLQNVANGTYSDWVEATFQYRSDTTTPTSLGNPANANLKALVLEMISSFTTPSVISTVNTSKGTFPFGTAGFLTAPSEARPANINGIVSLAGPINPLSHAIYPGTGAFATNDCRLPVTYSNNPANLNQGIQLVP
jgi:hypothetical protein